MDVSLENIGTPLRSLMHNNYHYPSVMTSRGCPYACSFCYLTIYKNRKYRTIPHETVLQDFDSIKDSSVVVVTDENFIGYSKKDSKDRKVLLNKIIKRNYKFIWGCQASVNIAEQPELMQLMYKAGCRTVFVGFESTDPESLKSISKRHNIGVDYKEFVFAYTYSYQANSVVFNNGGFHQLTFGFNFSCKREKWDCDCPGVN